MKFSFMTITNFFGGRTFFLILAFFGCGFYLALEDKLTVQYLGLSGSLATIAGLRAVFNDKYSPTPPTDPQA